MVSRDALRISPVTSSTEYVLRTTDRATGAFTDAHLGADKAAACVKAAAARKLIDGLLPGAHTYRLRAVVTESWYELDDHEDGDGEIRRFRDIDPLA